MSCIQKQDLLGQRSGRAVHYFAKTVVSYYDLFVKEANFFVVKKNKRPHSLILSDDSDFESDSFRTTSKRKKH